jgi:DNA repair exonuclease SbcCD ATPase subunit
MPDTKANSLTNLLWNQLGPLLLLGSFAVLQIKSTHLYWPLAFIAFLGYGAILYAKKKGLYLSVLGLASAFFLPIHEHLGSFWFFLLIGSILVSWLLILWGSEEILAERSSQEDKIQALEKNNHELEKKLREAAAALSKESKDLILEKQRLHTQCQDVQKQLEQALSSLQNTVKEKEKWMEKCEQLTQDLFATQRREVAFQHALNDAQAQLLNFKNGAKIEQPKADSIVPFEDQDAQEGTRFEQVQHQYANLREQFEEKSDALDQARKELFKVENELFTLKKAIDEKNYEVCEEELKLTDNFKMLEDELSVLEEQIIALQEFITTLLSPKKRSSRAPKSRNQNEEQNLPLLLEEKIDQTFSNEPQLN